MAKSMFSAAVAALAVTGASAQIFPRANSSAVVGATALSSVGTAISSLLATSVSSSAASAGFTSSANATSALSTSANATSALATLTANSTSSLTSATPSTTTAASASDPTFCPALNGQIYLGPLDVSYSIKCDVTYGGIELDITISSISKRDTSLQQCLTECSEVTACVGTAYDTDTGICTYYSQLGAATTADGVEFATVVSRDTNTTTSSSTASSNATATGIVGTSSATVVLTTGTGALSSSVAGASAPYPSVNSTSASTTSSSSVTSSSSAVVSPTVVGTATSSSSAAASTTSKPEDLFCPNLNGDIIIDGNSIEYIIECGTNHFGVIIDITIAKRQAATADTLASCLDLCDANAACVATAFNTNTDTCTLFSSIGASYADADVDFAIVNNPTTAASTTVTAGQTVTSIIYSTGVTTISSCAPTVTDCPLDASGATVVTEVIPVSETVYICPSATAIAAAGVVACSSCPYAVVTGTVYATTVETIYSCAPTVTDCPLDAPVTVGASATGVAAGAVAGSETTVYVTDVVSTTTTYCPAGATVTGASGSTTVLASGSVSTVTATASSTVTAVVYSTTNSAGAVSTVTSVLGSSAATTGAGVTAVTTTYAYAVATTEVNYPLPTSTGSAAAGTASVATSAAAGTASVATSAAGAVTTAAVSTAAGSSATNVVSQISDGQIQATATTTSGLTTYTGAANKLTGAGMAGAAIVGLAMLL